MEDPKESKIRELAQALTADQLQRFREVFPEFQQLSDSFPLRYLVSHAILFSRGEFENDVFLLSRVEAFKRVCEELIGAEIAESELFSWIANVGKSKKGKDSLDKFLINFKGFLSEKIGNIAQQAEVSSSVSKAPLATLEQVAEFKRKFPLFVPLDDKDPLLNHLVLLVLEAENAAKAGYSKDKKYSFFYYAVRIGAVVDTIVEKHDFPGINKQALVKADLTSLENMDAVDTNVLLGLEQCALFRVMRNIVADYFHHIDEKACERFFYEFSKLLRGQSCAPYAAQTKSSYKGEENSVYKKLKKKDRELAVNVLAQMKYFLEKAQFFIKMGDTQSACMALVAAGNCAKDFNLSTFNQRKMEVTGLIRILRDNNFAHAFEFWVLRNSLAQQLLVIPDYSRRIIEEGRVGHGLDVENAASSLGVASPRAYKK